MNEDARELKKISHILKKIGSVDLGEEVDSILAELLGNAFQGRMEKDLAEQGKLKKKPKFPKAPPPAPEEGGEEGMPPEEGGEMPPEGEEPLPEEEGEEPMPEEGEEPPPKKPAAPAKKAQIIITATNIPDDRKWIACENPKRETIKSGAAWTALCMFVEKKSKKVGYMKRVVSTAKRRPQMIKLGKNKIKMVSDVHAVGEKVKKKL